MKRTVMQRDIPFLPEEIITSILIRLPVKRLIRFRCVCKHWKNLFKTPSSIVEHLHHSTHQNPSLLFEDKEDRSRLRLCYREMQVLRVQSEPFIGSVRRSHIVDSCNGLLCIIDKNYSLYLWNPAIRDFGRVPKSINWFESDDYYLGFGYSAIVNDYKIVKIYVSRSDGDLVSLVEVYSLRTGSWKEVDCDSLDGVTISSNGFNTNGNGAIFWSGLQVGVEKDGEGDIDLIVLFDIATESFCLISAPTSAFTYSGYGNGLAIYENKLAVLSHTLSENLESSLVDLWVLDEDWEQWTKIYTSSPYAGLRLLPVTIWKDQIICDVTDLPEVIAETKTRVENDVHKNVMSSLTTNEFRMFGIHKDGKACHGYDIFSYAESLVPVSNFHIEWS
ncbi:hypothetical protein QN277_005715 [Acacia crassicarpa]|uniref:F-box domain-containing protein n=1 Tax=Acacia crassicarpa TaxID=499986 RepID=A0AAE1MBH5_9FABA|nr:hypothetical protein QN277_005715 [Acacia crassicarpa]